MKWGTVVFTDAAPIRRLKFGPNILGQRPRRGVQSSPPKVGSRGSYVPTQKNWSPNKVVFVDFKMLNDTNFPQVVSREI